MNYLPYTLNAEQTALFQGMQAEALFPGLATPGEGELVTLVKKANKEFKRKYLQPYADLLKTSILAKVRVDRAAFLDQLKKDNAMCAELYTWHTIRYNQTLTELQRARSAMSSEDKIESYRADRRTKQEIAENNWETLIHLEEMEDTGEMTTSMWEVKINDIFRFTDIADRVALALGPCFAPFTTWVRVEGLGSEEPSGFSVFKRTLCVRYYPFGVPLVQMQRLFEAAKRQHERNQEGKIRVVNHYEYVVISPPPTDPYADMPPLIPAPVSLLGASMSPIERSRCACFCGCDDE